MGCYSQSARECEQVRPCQAGTVRAHEDNEQVRLCQAGTVRVHEDVSR